MTSPNESGTVSIAQLMGEGKRAIVIAAHTRFRGRIIVRALFRGEIIEHASGQQLLSGKGSAEQNGARHLRPRRSKNRDEKSHAFMPNSLRS